MDIRKNPYKHEYDEYQLTRGDIPIALRRDYETRQEMVYRYAWAIPNKAAVKALKGKRIVEVGAGTGYWAAYLRAFRIDVIAYDLAVPGVEKNVWGHSRTYTEVLHGDARSGSLHPDRSLLLCWPPYDSKMAKTATVLYRKAGGKELIYIGEDMGGCTATDDFHTELFGNWEFTKCVSIPQWSGMHDSLCIYRRE